MSSKVSDKFLQKVIRELPSREEGPEAQLEYLLSEIRSRESSAATQVAQATYLREIAVDALLELERSGQDPEYVTSTRRTMGMLAYQPKTISGEGAQTSARRIRRHVASVLGASAARKSVLARRTVSYRIDWELISRGGPKLVEVIRGITGMKPKPNLIVGKVTKRAKLGKRRKGR